MTGRVGRYVIRDRIGRGGMGEIYTAHDERLDRVVVLKAISPALVDHDVARRRFLREARAAAALAHPFTCTIHEVLEHDAQPFIVMEYVEGETLRARLLRGPLAAADIVRIGSETAEALAAAHERGIIHRDVSAANIMLAPSGHVKVMDFGLASMGASAANRDGADAATEAADALTNAGALLGTPAYIAPEVLSGQRADARSDLYSLGVVLYQCCTGQLPFNGASVPLVIAEILNRTPPPPRSLQPDVPAALERVIVRLLAKDPSARFPDAQAVAGELRALTTSHPATPPSGMRSIAVLPFKDLAQDPANAHIGIGLADATITELALIKALIVRPTAAVMRYQQSVTDPLEAGRQLGVDSIVDASFQRSGSRLRVTVQLLDTTDGRSLWAGKITASLDDVFEMQDEVSRQITRALEVRITDRDQARGGRPARVGAAAYELYLKGRFHLLRETPEHTSTAIDYFERAIAADPSFALARAGLADAYLYTAFSWDPDGDWYSRAARLCEETLRLDPDLPEAHYLRGRLLWCPDGGFNHAEALREFGMAIAARPGLYEAHHWIGIVLFHVSLLTESLAHFERALAINPDDEVASMHLAFALYLQGAFQAAFDRSDETRRRAPSAWAFYQLALAEIQLGRRDDAERTVNAAARQFPGHVLFYPLRGLIAALRGDADGALEHVELTRRHARSFGHYHHAQYDVACIQATLGKTDAALRWLTEGATNGFPCAVFFERDPLLASIREDLRFTTLMRTLNDECARYGELYRTMHTSSIA